MLTSEKKRKQKQKKIRHMEYYNLVDVFDKLYADSKDGKVFTGLMEIICYPSNYPRLESSDYLGNNRQNQCGQMTNRSIICGSEVALFAVKKLASDAAVTSTRDSRRNPSLWLFLVG